MNKTIAKIWLEKQNKNKKRKKKKEEKKRKTSTVVPCDVAESCWICNRQSHRLLKHCLACKLCGIQIIYNKSVYGKLNIPSMRSHHVDVISCTAPARNMSSWQNHHQKQNIILPQKNTTVWLLEMIHD